MNHILIAEDEHLIARLVEMTLTRAGYRCTVAEDGRTAADLIEKTDFDMAILDIMLPGLDGYDLLASLKPQGVPVIFLTAKSAVKDRVLGLRLGADDYITKPFAAEELVARMETVLRRTGRGGRELRAHVLTEAVPFKGRVVGVLQALRVCQGVDNFHRDFFALRHINDLSGRTVEAVRKKQNLKGGALHIAVKTSLFQIHVRVRFEVDTEVDHVAPPYRWKASELE